MISKKEFIILIAVIILFYLSAYVNNSKIVNVKFIIVILELTYILLIKKYKVIGKISRKVIVLFLFIYIFLNVVGITINPYFEIFFNIATTILIAIYVYIISNIIYKYKYINTFLKVTSTTITIFLINCYILYSRNLFDINYIKNAFNIEQRTNRYYMGLSHPNSLGFIALVNAICLYSIAINDKKSIKRIIIPMLFSVLLILNSGSRGSLISFILYIILRFIFRMFGYLINLKNKKKNLTMIILINLVLILFISIFSTNNINFEKIFRKTNRQTVYIDTINILNESNDLILGRGYMNMSSMKKHSEQFKLGMDSWYIGVIVRSGILGLFLNIIFLLLIILNIIKNKNLNVYDRRNSIILLLVLIFFGFFENVVIQQSTIISLIFWIIIMKSIWRGGNLRNE